MGIKFEDEFTDDQFVEYLLDDILAGTSKNLNLLISEYNSVARKLIKSLRVAKKKNIQFHILIHNRNQVTSSFPDASFYVSLTDFLQREENIDKIICVNTRAKNIYAFFCEVQKYPVLFNIPFVYKIRGGDSYPLLKEQDQWKEIGINETHVYITNQFDDGLFDSIYRYSLEKVRRKCQIRDAYDLYQCLVTCQNIEGDIIECGSYEGHSGLIIAEFLKRKKFQKKLYLCDTFKEFPKMHFGIDHPWSEFNNKNFNYSHVKSVFESYEFVKLIKGEFKQTLGKIPTKKFSLAYVDCDSYEATRCVSEYIYPKLSAGGCIVFEDYGHHALLGARRAIDQFIYKNRDNLFCFFSFFSGLKIVVKRNWL
jgi:hypothetical protein